MALSLWCPKRQKKKKIDKLNSGVAPEVMTRLLDCCEQFQLGTIFFLLYYCAAQSPQYMVAKGFSAEPETS